MCFGLFHISDVLILISILGYIERYCFNILPLNTTTVEGYIFEFNPKGEVTKCIFEDFGNQTIEITVNQSRKNYEDCHDCLCSVNGMTCCGFGHKAGRIGVEEGFEIKHLTNCDFELVETNRSRPADGGRASYLPFRIHIILAGVIFATLFFMPP